jgi:hypothetical protein
MKHLIYGTLSLIVAALALGAADATETTRRAVKLYGAAQYPAACKLVGAKVVGRRIEAWGPAPSPCVPLMSCGPLLVYRYEAQAGSTAGLPFCPTAIINGVWQ